MKKAEGITLDKSLFDSLIKVDNPIQIIKDFLKNNPVFVFSINNWGEYGYKYCLSLSKGDGIFILVYFPSSHGQYISVRSETEAVDFDGNIILPFPQEIIDSVAKLCNYYNKN